MNTFTPTIRQLDPPDAPDYLAGSVLHGLTRGRIEKSHWRLVRSVFWGVVTFGLAPLFVWPKLFRNFTALEQQNLWHLAEWLRLRTGREEAVALQESANQMRFRAGFASLMFAAAAVVVVGFVAYFRRYSFNVEELLQATYGAQYPGSLTHRLFILWTAGLSVGYLLHWTHVQFHLADVRRFARKFNDIARHVGVSPVPMPRLGLGLRPSWLFAGVIMIFCGALWGLPMALAGALHQRYVLKTSKRLQNDLAHRVRAILLLDRPTMRVPVLVQLRNSCPRELCRAPVPQTANFCPRCGAAVASVLNQVA